MYLHSHQGFRPLILFKTKDRFTSLMVIGVTKIMCNNVPHFGWGKHINACVKQLLARVHIGILWMDRPVPITMDLIATITGLPIDGENLEKYLEDKTKAKAISDEIKAKYGAECSNRGIGINDINDHVTRFSTRLLR